MLFRSVSQSRYQVAVLVNETNQFIEYIQKDFDYLQLHGDEDLKRVKELKKKYNKKIIKAIKVTDESSAKIFKEF